MRARSRRRASGTSDHSGRPEDRVCDHARMDGAAFEYLLSGPGQGLLREVESAYAEADALVVGSRLRSRHDPAYVAAALTQVRLRRKAVDKLGEDAARMYFTPTGLEQATAGPVAAHRAGRIEAAGHQRLLDLGCGIGADLVAAAMAGLTVHAVDRDPVTVAIARANLAALGLTGAVSVGDAREPDRSAYDIVFADPARRGARGRTFDPAAYSPPWSFVEELLAGAAVVKVAPGIPHALVPADVETEWVSLAGRLREAALWSRADTGVQRRATVIDSAGTATSVTDAEDPGHPAVRDVGRFVYEPDDAVIRAHLVTAVAADVAGWLLDPHLAYVSSDLNRPSRLARVYAVQDVLPFKEKQLRAALRARGVGPLTIKKRGVQVTPETLRKRLGLEGSTPATIIITRTPTSAAVLLVEPLTRVEPPTSCR